jgi:hypothetical protein
MKDLGIDRTVMLTFILRTVGIDCMYIWSEIGSGGGLLLTQL